MLPDNRHFDFSLPPQEMSLTKTLQKCHEAYHAFLLLSQTTGLPRKNSWKFNHIYPVLNF